MITLLGRTLDIPAADRVIGQQGDSLSEIRQFKITDPSLFGLSFKLDTETPSGKDIYDLTKTAEEGCIILTWTVTNLHTRLSGDIHVQLRGFDNSGCVWHSFCDYFCVNDSIYTTEDFMALSPTEFEEMEQRVTHMKEQCEDNAADAEAYAVEAETYAGNALISAAAVGINADNAAASEAAAAASAQQAVAAGASAEAARVEAERLSAQMSTLMSQQPRQFLVKTLNERDALTNLRHCDRCDVTDEQTTYIYDTADVDGNGKNPEWLAVSKWDALTGVSWSLVTDKPAFADVAFSGDYTSLRNLPNRYESFAVNSSGIWDFSVSDKIFLSADTNLSAITNIYGGAVGIIYTQTDDITLPSNSLKSADFDYITKKSEQYWVYTFLYDGSKFLWNRTVFK